MIQNFHSQNINNTEKIQLLASIDNNGAIHSLAKNVTTFYQSPPASSTEYIASIKDNLADKKIISPIYAQSSTGYGFQALRPLLNIWRAFRNITYLIFILAFVIYGFMIMFQMKINPQTVINIQLAIPKLITTLLLISFSYAIAGFIIDLFYLIWGFLLNVFVSGDLIFPDKLEAAKRLSGYSAGLFLPFTTMFAHLTLGALITKIWAGIYGVPVGLVNLSQIIVPFLAGNILLTLVLLIAILYTFVKIFWMLLKSYIYIILNIIFSPIILLSNLIPGSNAFAGWVKNITAELSIFAAVMFMFVLTFYFLGPIVKIELFGLINPPLTIGNIGKLDTSGPFWFPPPLGGSGPMLNWDSEGKFAILGLGIFLMTPKIAEMIKNALKMRDYGYGSALGSALAFGLGPITGPLGFIWGGVAKEWQGTLGGMLGGGTVQKVFPKTRGTYKERLEAISQPSLTPTSEQLDLGATNNTRGLSAAERERQRRRS